MEELFSKIAHCVEFGKINKVSPYLLDMKGQDGADELAKQALDSGANPGDVLLKALMPGMEKMDINFLFLRYL